MTNQHCGNDNVRSSLNLSAACFVSVRMFCLHICYSSKCLLYCTTTVGLNRCDSQPVTLQKGYEHGIDRDL
jgi:hypothetical protein